MSDYVTKDSGQRAEFPSGMVRDTQDGKARFDLMLPEGVPYDAQFLTRVAQLMTRGIAKYGERNWEKANSQQEVDRFRASAYRHLMQYLAGETDEDHAAAVVFNLLAAETIEFKRKRHGETVATLANLRMITRDDFKSAEGIPDDDTLRDWLRDNPIWFENWVRRYRRIHGRGPI